VQRELLAGRPCVHITTGHVRGLLLGMASAAAPPRGKLLSLLAVSLVHIASVQA